MIQFLKRNIRKVYPPKYGWRGKYDDWDKLSKQCTTYSNNKIIKRVQKAAKQVQMGKAAFERDSVTFHNKEINFPLYSSILLASKDNNLNIIDFGGSLGSSYFQHLQEFRPFLKKWNIVEQEKFVAIGNKDFKNNTLSFHNQIDNCYDKRACNFLIISSSLQYLKQPYDWIKSHLSKFQFNWIYLDRIPTFENEDRLTLQSVHPSIYDASYPCWIFNEKKLSDAFLEKYTQEFRFNSYGYTVPIYQPEDRFLHKGFLFKLK